MTESRQHVAEQTERLQAIVTELKDDVCKALLLTKISQSSPIDGPNENTPYPSCKYPAVSSSVIRAIGTTANGYFDSGENKKKAGLVSQCVFV